jgi:hypothetical protein
VAKLRSRIVGQHRANRAAQAGMHPWGTADTPLVMPMTHVQFGPGGAAVQVMTPLVTDAPDGAMIPATAPGQYGQVAVSGRP